MPLQRFEGAVDSLETFQTTLTMVNNKKVTLSKLEYQFNNNKDEGFITFPGSGTSLSVSHERRSSQWRLHAPPVGACASPVQMLAIKEKAWRRNFDISDGKSRYVISPDSPWRSDFTLRRARPGATIIGRHVAGKVVGKFRMQSNKNWSYRMVFDDDIRFEILAFCFWLVTLLSSQDTANS